MPILRQTSPNGTPASACAIGCASLSAVNLLVLMPGAPLEDFSLNPWTKPLEGRVSLVDAGVTLRASRRGTLVLDHLLLYLEASGPTKARDTGAD